MLHLHAVQTFCWQVSQIIRKFRGRGKGAETARFAQWLNTGTASRLSMRSFKMILNCKIPQEQKYWTGNTHNSSLSWGNNDGYVSAEEKKMSLRSVGTKVAVTSTVFRFLSHTVVAVLSELTVITQLSPEPQRHWEDKQITFKGHSS